MQVKLIVLEEDGDDISLLQLQFVPDRHLELLESEVTRNEVPIGGG